jgi:F-type H+-transporting ATPase subunit epsilon
MAATIKLEIVTPEAKIFSDDVDMVTLTGTEGEMGILPQHMPLMTQLVAGEIIAQKGKETIFICVGDGFVQVTGDRVAILTDMAINAENIDEARAEEALRRAEARLAEIPARFTSCTDFFFSFPCSRLPVLRSRARTRCWIRTGGSTWVTSWARKR